MKNLPIKLCPSYKDYLWGGNRINDDYGKSIPVSPLAETWECSTHPEGPSYTEDGDDLKDLLRKHPEWLGEHPLHITGGIPELPILIKLIDAKADLSVQVHPDDEYALSNEGERGKAEAWYVLDAKPESTIVYGFNQDLKAEQIRNAVKSGTIEKFLNRIKIKKNDVFFVNPGTVHAIGSGVLIAEIQESSNITYRIYDYDRVGKDGRKRTLQIEKALDVLNLKGISTPRQPMRVLRYNSGHASELLCRCQYFQVERMLLNTDIKRDFASFITGKNSFHSLLCLDGCGVIFGEDITIPFFKGDCIFIPAESIPLKLHGTAQFLDICC